MANYVCSLHGAGGERLLNISRAQIGDSKRGLKRVPTSRRIYHSFYGHSGFVKNLSPR